MSSFAERLLGSPARESSGGPSSNRHQFHRTWALCHLLKLHESGAAYLLVMEYHDDVIVLDSDTEPQTGRFFQLKTKKTGNWTRAQLTAIDKKLRNGSGPRSILGKLMDHGIRFGPHVVGLTVVSNAAFNFEMKAHPPSIDRDEVLVTELDEKEAEALRATVQTELQCGDDLPWDRVSFWATGISLTDHESYGIGQLAKFVEHRNPGCLVAVAPLFRTLRDELGRRGDAEIQPTNFDDLCRIKGIRRADLEEFLQVADRSEAELSVAALRSELAHESMPYRERSNMIAGLTRYALDRTDRTNRLVQEFRTQIAAVVSHVYETMQWSTLTAFLVAVTDEYTNRHRAPEAPFDDKYLKGAALFELKKFEARQHSSANSQPPSQTA